MAARNYTRDARAMFEQIIAETGLTYEADRNAPVELLWKLPVQPGLNVEMIFGLQNNDELNLGIGTFWSYMFPFETAQHTFRRCAIGFIRGECRVVEWRTLGLLSKRTLEERRADAWRTAYTEYLLPVPIPFASRRASEILNTRGVA